MFLDFLRKQLGLPILFLALFQLAACSSSSDTDTTDDDTTVALSALEDVPNATDPVVASGSASLGASTQPAAAVGFGDGTTIADFEGGSGSYGSCEMINRMRGAIGQAGQGSMIMCFMQQLLEGNEDIYDGEYHVFDLDFSDSEDSDDGAPDHIKIKVERDGDTISSFELFACQDGDQTHYFSGSIDASTLTMVNKGASVTGEGSSVAFAGSVTGEISEDGEFIGEKIIELDYINDFGGGEGNYCDTTTVATDNTIEFSGYCVNTGENTGVEALFAIADLDDGDSPSINDWGLGAGAAKIVSDNNTDGEEITQGWDEDGLIDEDSTYLSDAGFVAGSVPESSDTPPDVDFVGDEIYDCSDTAESTLTNELQDLMTSCSSYDLTQEHIECQDGTEI